MRSITIVSAVCGLFVLPLLISGLPRPDNQLPPGGRYIGSAMCKNCHKGAEKGDQYEHWSKTPHANAYKTLATPQAKAVGKKLGVAEPQKSEKCLKCHVTAYGADPKLFKSSFKMELGVQCESCHGPGETHQRKRFREAMKRGTPPSPIAADEIVLGRSSDTCKKCHNQESPNYKPFCLKERMKVVEHLDPRKKRSKEELKKLRETCSKDCEVCAAEKNAAEKNAAEKNAAEKKLLDEKKAGAGK